MCWLMEFFKKDDTKIDNRIFWLHSKVTSIILLTFSIIVLSTQFFSVAIQCTDREMSESSVNTYCWMQSTFSISDAWQKKVGEDVPYPGLDKFRPGDKKVYHFYYRWVGYLLLLQAIFFYIPRYFWKNVEGGKIRSLVSELNSPMLPEDKRRNNQKLLVNYMKSNMHRHNRYFISYIFAEALNFVNVVGQIYLLDTFLGGEFSTYGLNVIQFTEWSWPDGYNPMIKVFPRVTKCTLYKYGSSGVVQRNDASCFLPINDFNEKIFLFIWFWFILLAVLSGTMIVYRTVTILWPKSRFLIIRSRANRSKEENLRAIISKCRIGDWLILDFLSMNLDPLNFRDVINDLASKGDINESSISS